MQELDFPKDVLGQQGHQLQTVRVSVLVNPKSEDALRKTSICRCNSSKTGRVWWVQPPSLFASHRMCYLLMTTRFMIKQNADSCFDYNAEHDGA